MRPVAYKHYVLGVLTVVLMFSYVDRVALGVVLQAIKVDFGLSDTQLGFLGGIGFALFFSVMGLPIARWADRGNRVTIIALACALWSVAVALSGLAGSFALLVLIRVAVAVGEAGCVPTSFSLIADYFNRAERPRAVSIYGLGGTFALVAGYFLGGWLNDHYGWRITFMVLGIPGVFLALLVRLTVREPRRERAAAHAAAGRQSTLDQPNMAAVCTTVWTNVTFRRLVLCLSGLLFFNVGIGQWLPAFFIRSHGLTAEQVGAWLAMVMGMSGLLGAYTGGELASRYAVHKESLQLRVMAMAVSGSGAAAVFAFLAPSAHTAFALFGLHCFGLSAITGVLFATMQTLVSERMRAMAFAIAYLIGNLLGLGFGPLATGALSDLYQAWAHEESLRYALLTLAPGYLFVAWQAWRASRTVARDVTTVDGSTPMPAQA
jgi:MFS family permease